MSNTAPQQKCWGGFYKMVYPWFKAIINTNANLRCSNVIDVSNLPIFLDVVSEKVGFLFNL